MRPLRVFKGRTFLRHVLYLLSLGLAVHLVLPQIAGLEHSLRLVTKAAPLLIVAALLAELSSALCYSELMGRSVGTATGLGTSIRSRRQRGLGRWFMLRLTVSEVGASHVLPGGGASMAAVTYGALRTRDFEPGRIGLALAVMASLIYGALGVIFAGSLAYILLSRELGTAGLIATLFGLIVTLVAFLGSYEAYRRPQLVRRLLNRTSHAIFRAFGFVFRRNWSEQRAKALSKMLVARLREEVRATRQQLLGRPGEALRLLVLAFGYWVFDFLCLFLIFWALGVPAGTIDLLVAYGIATATGAIPITPGGVGVFEATMLAILTLLGVGPDAIVAILGYRLFNFWLPIPLAAILYPTLHWKFGRRGKEPEGG